jgi:flavin reductase (DIM6/NTAB) family NADH-FMN oxidoreductase RutF
MVIGESSVRQVMEVMPYGLYIIGSTGENGPNGMMADWVTQVSFNPRLISMALENDSQTLANIKSTLCFTVNFLKEGTHGMDLARRFSAPYRGSKVGGPMARGVHDKLSGERHRSTARGCPILDAAMAWLDCEAVEFLPTGDHTLVVGKVIDGQLRVDSAPLTSSFTGWTYSG